LSGQAYSGLSVLCSINFCGKLKAPAAEILSRYLNTSGDSSGDKALERGLGVCRDKRA
jgi:hypothetical protein